MQLQRHSLLRLEVSGIRGKLSCSSAAPLCALLSALVCLLLADPSTAVAQTVGSLDSSETGGSTMSGLIVQILAATTVLSLAPGLLIAVTAFTRIIIVLSLLRMALGLQQTPPNIVLIALALFLTSFVMTPTLERAWIHGVVPLNEGIISEEEAARRIITPFHDFMLTHVRNSDLEAFMALADATTDKSSDLYAETSWLRFAPNLAPASNGSVPNSSAPNSSAPSRSAPSSSAQTLDAPVELRSLMPAFLVSELRRAFEIGFLLFMGFLVIDMIVAAVLMAMGMMMVPPVIVSLPFKLAFFVLIDGWALVSISLARSFLG